MLSRLCHWIAKRWGWTLVNERPEATHYVLIGYPHTSNWDFILAMLFKFGVGLQFNWIAKQSLFRWPLGSLMRALGGIGVDRAHTRGLTAALAARIKQHPQMIIAITPEGTRGHTEFWRSGFYHLALATQLPVALGYICYRSKKIGIGPLLQLSGDPEADLLSIRAFYADKVARYPEQAGSIRFRPR